MAASGAQLDDTANAAWAGRISTPDGVIAAFLVLINEIMIAHHTTTLVGAAAAN